MRKKSTESVIFFKHIKYKNYKYLYSGVSLFNWLYLKQNSKYFNIFLQLLLVNNSTKKTKSCDLQFFFFNFLFEMYLVQYFTITFKIRLYNLIKTLKSSEILKKARILKKLTPRNFNIYYFEQLVSLFLISFKTKNIIFFIDWFKKILQNKPLKQFKTFVYYAYRIIVRLIWSYRSFYNIKGIFFKFKGKFIKGGGRKKKLKLRLGCFSRTRKNLKILTKFFCLRTISGSIGCTFQLVY